jgi:hypothetical protein
MFEYLDTAFAIVDSVYDFLMRTFMVVYVLSVVRLTTYLGNDYQLKIKYGMAAYNL